MRDTSPYTGEAESVGGCVIHNLLLFYVLQPLRHAMRATSPYTGEAGGVGGCVIHICSFFVLQPLRHATRATSPYTGEAESGGGCVIPLRHHSGKGGNENYTSLYL